MAPCSRGLFLTVGLLALGHLRGEQQFVRRELPVDKATVLAHRLEAQSLLETATDKDAAADEDAVAEEEEAANEELAAAEEAGMAEEHEGGFVDGHAMKKKTAKRSMLAPAPGFQFPVASGSSKQVEEWYPMGCFARLATDNSTPGVISGARDTYCKTFNQTSGQVCRSGLPFYRFVANDLHPGVCQDYCLGKGLDICGLVAGKECRCGATTRLRELWGRIVLPHLMFQDEQDKLRDGSDLCEIIAYKYIGAIEEGGVPSKMLTRTAMDFSYIQDVGCPANNCRAYSDAP